MIEFEYGDGIDIAFGGGRKNFFPIEDKDVEIANLTGKRGDKRNLIKEWLNKTTNRKYVHNLNGFNYLDPNKDKNVLGSV